MVQLQVHHIFSILYYYEIIPSTVGRVKWKSESCTDTCRKFSLRSLQYIQPPAEEFRCRAVFFALLCYDHDSKQTKEEQEEQKERVKQQWVYWRSLNNGAASEK